MKSLWVLVFVGLAGCGSAYISPSVQEVPQSATGSAQVKVVPLTNAAALQANRSSYQPRSLPSAFSRIAKVPGSSVNAIFPDATLDPERRPKAVEMRIPPKSPISPYKIGIADVLLLSTPSASSTVEQLSGLLAAQNKRQGYTVQDDGAIAIPDVGRVIIDGLTIEEAEAEIFQALVSAQFTPTFSLEIAEFNSQRVSIGGSVASPILAPITLKPLYLEEALQLAGGVTAPDLDYATVRLYRRGQLFQIPLKQLYAKTELKRIRLQEGDSIFVDTEYELGQAQAYFTEQITLLGLRNAAKSQALAELTSEFSIRQSQLSETRSNFEAHVSLGAIKRDYVYLSGEVAQQGRFPLPFEQKASLADALFSQSGISTREGNVSQIYLLRSNTSGDAITAYQLDASNIANMVVATRMELRPNDILFVSEQPITKWNRVIAQIVPSLLTASVGALAQ